MKGCLAVLSSRMSSANSYGRCAAVLYCEKLLGLLDDCNMPGCREWEKSTGWLVHDVSTGGWFVGFECPDHGRSAAWKPEWQSLIDEAIGRSVREGFDLTTALQELRDAPEEGNG